MYFHNESKPEQLSDNTEIISATEQARELAITHRFEEALLLLREKGLLDEQIARIKTEYGERLANPDLQLSESDWEMLTVLELYDTDTTEHSVRVYENAASAIQRTLTLDNGTPFQLTEYLAEEGVSKRDFLHAALFHDIGKTIIPHSILKDKTTKVEFDTCFCEQAEQRGEAWLQAMGIENTQNATDALDTLYTQHKRPLDVLPLKDVIDPEKYTELQEMFPYVEIDEETTFRDILMLHEGESERILKEQGEPISGTIAGQHHNYAKLPLVYPRSTSALRIARTGVYSKLSDILHVVDVSDAIRHARSYKDAQDEYQVLNELIADANAGRIDPLFAHAWINAEYQNIISTENSVTNPEKLTPIKEFLATPIDTAQEVV